MSITALIQNYGYIALFIGTFLEGETILIMAGFAAHRGYLDLRWVMVVATLGGFLGDQLYFYLGAHYGWRILNRFPKLKPRAIRVQTLLERYHLPIIPGIRFFYGFRTVGPLAIGMSSVSWIRFLALNLLGATVWAILVGGLGYLSNDALELVLADIGQYEEVLLAMMAIGGVIIWLSYNWRHR